MHRRQMLEAEANHFQFVFETANELRTNTAKEEKLEPVAELLVETAQKDELFWPIGAVVSLLLAHNSTVSLATSARFGVGGS